MESVFISPLNPPGRNPSSQICNKILLAARGEQPGEVVELVAIEVGDHPVAHAAEREALDVEALARAGADLRLAGRGPDEDVDDVLPPLVYQYRHRLAGGVIEPRAGELEAVLRQVRDRRRERQPRAEPGLHRVLVRRGDVDEAAAERGAHMARHDFARQRIFGGWKFEQGTEGEGDHGDEGECRSKPEEFLWRF